MEFDEIPIDLLEPGAFLEIKPNYANAGILPYPSRVLIIGAALAAGTLAAGQVLQIARTDEATALFGQGSIGVEQVRAFRETNRTTPLFVTALADDAGAVKATGALTLTGAVGSGTVLRLKIAGRPVRATLAAGDTLAVMAGKIADAINADANMIVTAAVDGVTASKVNITSRHGGEVGNDIDIRVDLAAQPLPQGLNVEVTAMAGGAGNPDMIPALDAVANDWFTQFQFPWADATNMALVAADLAARFKAMARMDAHAFVARRGTFGELGAFGDLTNSPHISALGLKRSPTSPWVLSAAVAGLAAFHLTNDPARQLRSLAVTGVDAPDAPDQFTEAEQDLLLRQGLSTFDALSDGTLTVSRLITTYKTSSLGVPDRAWLDIMVPATLSRIRYDWSVYVTLLYPRAKLVDNEGDAAFVGRSEEDEDPGSAVVTPRRMHASWAGRCRLYSERAWIENVERTIKESTFARSGTDKNRLESRQQVSIVGNLMVLAGSLEFQV